MARGFPLSALGLIVSGDLGGETMYTDRFGKIVSFPLAPPKEKPTSRQMWVRTRFKTAQAAYMSLTTSVKADWEDLTKRTNLCMTGQNLYIHVAMKGSYALLNTLISQSGVTVAAPNRV